MLLGPTVKTARMTSFIFISGGFSRLSPLIFCLAEAYDANGRLLTQGEWLSMGGRALPLPVPVGALTGAWSSVWLAHKFQVGKGASGTFGWRGKC